MAAQKDTARTHARASLVSSDRDPSRSYTIVGLYQVLIQLYSIDLLRIRW